MLTAFIVAVESTTKGVLYLPKELVGELQLHQSGVRLWRKSKAVGQTQMTAAEPIKKNVEEVPHWWIEDLHWDSLPYLKSILSGLSASSFIGGNPKRAFGDRLIKSPILSLLGKHKTTPSESQQLRWVKKIEAYCKIKPVQIVAAGLVKASKKTKNDALDKARFTHREYLLGLLNGRDQVTEWARTAFGGDEDMGLGQIDDETLDTATFAIVETRESKAKLQPREFLAAGQA